MLLPLAALLNGLGYVIIARLDTDLAGLQATWTLVGIAAYVATLFVVRRVRDLRPLQVDVRPRRHRPAAAAVRARRRLGALDGARLWVSIGPINFQPGEFAKIALAIFFAAYLDEQRELLAAGTWKVGPLHLPEPRHLGPMLLAWARRLVVMIGQKDLGSSLLFFALFVVLLWVATERASYLAIGGVLFAAGAYVAWNAVRPRAGPRRRSGSTRGADARRQGLPDRPGHVRPGVGRRHRHRARPRRPDPHPRGARTTSSSPPSARSSACSAPTACIVAYLLMVGAGLRIAIRAERTVREAARHRPHDDPRRAGVHHHRRRHPGAAAHRRHAPVRQLRRIVAVANYVLLALLMRISDSTRAAHRRDPATHARAARERRAAPSAARRAADTTASTRR